MVARGEPGSIVNVITMSAHGGQPFLAAYASSKGALMTLTRNAAYAHRADRIRINGLNIGWTDTPGEDEIQRRFHGASDGWQEAAGRGLPFGRLNDPDEAANMIALLLSDASGIVTGSLIDWDQTVVGTYD
jgi:NAD(P)-dependent dehydrogenase (short-subunit alcohol dehydrogenase family)